MCDISPLRNWLIAALVSLTAAAALVGAAAIANGSFVGAASSPGLMIAGGLAASAAVAFVSLALNALSTYCNCLMGRCEGQCSNLRNNLYAFGSVLTFEAAACFALAKIAWIPLGGMPAIIVLAGSLFLQGPLLISAIAFVVLLVQCGSSAGPPPV